MYSLFDRFQKCLYVVLAGTPIILREKHCGDFLVYMRFPEKHCDVLVLEHFTTLDNTSILKSHIAETFRKG